MDNHYKPIDLFKGIAVILMIIYHFYYFPHQYGFTEIKYNTDLLKTFARMAQIIFILSVGINLYFSKRTSQEKEESEKEYTKKHFKRIGKLFLYALAMSIFTYFVFGDKFVKFGILHFIALSSLLLFNFVEDKMIIGTIIILLVFIYGNHTNISLFDSVPKPLGFIMGINTAYPAVDHFPLIPWMILICLGILIAPPIYENRPKIYPNTAITTALETTGKYSLEIYAIHWLILYYIYCSVYPKYIRPNI